MLYKKKNKIRVLCFIFLLSITQFLYGQVDSLTDVHKNRMEKIHQYFDTIPIITYNGAEISLEEYLNLSPCKIGTVIKYGPPLSCRLYGEKGKNGVISLFEQPNFKVNYNFTRIDDHNFIPTYFFVSEIPAMFPGGDDSLRVFLDKNTSVPEDFYDLEIEGDVEVVCYIDEKGIVSDYKVKSVHVRYPYDVVLFLDDERNTYEHIIAPYKRGIDMMKEVAGIVVEKLPPFIPAISFLHPVKYVKPIYVTFSFHQTETVEKRK